MCEPPLVSVIIPFYNTNLAFLNEAVQSVVRQSLGEWEIILVDDGSTDSSSTCAVEWTRAFPKKIRYLEHENHVNLGTSAACRLGIGKAVGKYIALLDSDDVWLPGKLERHVAILEDHPEAGMLCGDTKYWFSWTGKVEDNQKDYVQASKLPANSILNAPDYLSLLLEGRVPVPCTCSVTSRRDVVRKVGGFDELQSMYSDQRFYSRMALAAPVIVSGECWEHYRQHGESVCSLARQRGEVKTLHHEHLRWLANLLAQQGVTNDRLWQALGRQLWLYDDALGMQDSSFVKDKIRQIKKNLLRIEERILPRPLRRRIWSAFLATRVSN